MWKPSLPQFLTRYLLQQILALISWYSSRFHLEKPNFLLTKIFCLPENLNLLLLRAST